MGMSAKVLQLAKAAQFGADGRVRSVADAVVCLGLDTIRTLLLTLHAISEFQPVAASHFSMPLLWQYSLATGALAESVIQKLPAKLLPAQSLPAAGDAHGHMRMVGRLVLAANLPEDFERAYQLALKKQIAHWEAEREVFGTTHAEAGAYLLGLWGLPETMVEAVAYHHTPARCPHPGSAMLTALHVASALASAAIGYDATLHGAEPDLEYLAGMDLAGRLPEWRELCRQTAADEVACG
jgi:HD-like signal output (HDOD) protein